MTGRTITELDQQTVERIAAGEVVERPASAVKELVENSIDAEASRVEVTVEAGGTDLIRVSDDGVGMDEQTLRRAVEEHTTSKIADVSDLESGVLTLGFRGEALHAIGAVSRMTITSRPHDGGQGTELTVEGGEVTGISPAGCPPGTTVEIRDLFYNVPARRKYLKQETTEFAHVNTIVTNYALANPDVAVSLEHDGRETFATAGSGDRQAAVLSVYGREVAEAMVPVDADCPEGPLESISGHLSHPETNRSSREYLSTFVNGRYVTAGTVRDAILDAYGQQLAADRYPFTVLFLTVDPGEVDVNVHPRKREIRFAEEAAVHDQVETVVRESLLSAGLVRTSAPRGSSAAEQTEISPATASESDFAPGGSPDGAGDTPEKAADGPGGEATGSATDSGGSTAVPEPTSFTIDNSTVRRPDPADTGPESDGDRDTEADTATEAGQSTDETPETPTASTASTDRSSGTSPVNSAGEFTDRSSGTSPVNSAGESTDRSSGDRPDSGAGGPASTGGKHGKFSGGHHQDRFDTPETSYDSLPSMRVLGQFRETYVVAETDTGLVLIDQHAADERINYERLRESFAGETTTQALADPVCLDLTAQEAALFDTRGEALTHLGFQARLVGERTLEVSTVPALPGGAASPELVRDVLGEFVSGSATTAETVEAAADELLADLACYPSVTGNTSLTDGSVLELLSALDDCENPYACPHGRPVIVELDADDIAARFERDYPGHG